MQWGLQTWSSSWWIGFCLASRCAMSDAQSDAKSCHAHTAQPRLGCARSRGCYGAAPGVTALPPLTVEALTRARTTTFMAC